MVLNVPKLEADLGIEVYASNSRGVNGKIRSAPEDFIVEEVLTDRSKASIQHAGTTATPSVHGRYIVCVLIKKGWDTLVAVREIANQLDIDPERISIAGIKDAQALTAQHVSIGGIPPQKVAKIDLKDVTIHPIRFSSEKISSRLLFGNQFNIIVRSIKLSSKTVQKRIEEVRNELMDSGGIPNFFGHQRFGTVRPVTHQIGRHLVKENFEEAALVFLSEPNRHEHPEARKARKRLQETRDFKSALKFFPRKLMYERLMLRHLSKYSKDFLGAFRRLPPNLRIFFVQAYQSYLFNLSLSERIKRGIPLNKAQPGDYVANMDEMGLPMKSSEKVEKDNVQRINEEIGKKKIAVAIPLVGFKQTLSGGVQGEIEMEILEKEEINPQNFRIQKMLEASAAGSLRTALAPILNLNIEEHEPSDQNGINIKFSFTLHKGSYATVLLREFMKPKDLIKAGF